MKATFGSMFAGVIVLMALLYAVYVASGAGTCGKIERGTDWLKWGAMAVQAAARPWVDDSSAGEVHATGVRARLGFAKFLQRYNDNLRCPWDEVAAPSKASTPSIPPLPPRGAN